MNKNTKFIDCFINTKFRYIDQTGAGRVPISSNVVRPDLNLLGYEAYQTVNGFADCNDNTKEQCININSFFIDIDDRKDPKELEKIKKLLEPSFIVETFRGYHIYYLLDETLYKEDYNESEWVELISRWEALELSLVKHLNGDKVVKDITRIMRQVDTFYWKKTGDKYKTGTDGVFKIKGIHKNLSCTYSFDQMEEVFPIQKDEVVNYNKTIVNETLKNYAEGEKKDFFTRVNEEYPIEKRPSFQALISGKEGTVAPNTRNHALLITATLMRQAGWSKKKALEHIAEVGWHGIEKEKGGLQEIATTISSAYANEYTYSYKHEVISRNMTPEEQQAIQETYTKVGKAKNEINKIRYSNYEREILSQHPYLKKNEAGIVFNYQNGVYKMLNDIELSSIVLNSLYEDMLWNYRTQKHVSDKVACLLSIIPDLELTDDKGHFMNLKNGLLHIYTRELYPHTPNFVSLIQSPAVYDPKAEAPTWLSCVDAWMEGPEKEEKTLLLQQYSGYLLSSSMLYDRALFLVGDGGNGKSTFVDTLSMVIGTEATSHIDLESLYGQYGMKGLIGKRLNIIEEVHNNYYQSNKLKKLISGEKITIDVKYKDQFDFRPQAKFVFAVNMMPRVDDTSTATERRMCVVLFKNNFRNNPNTALRSDRGLLAKEMSGILNWMLDGAKKLADMGNFVVTQEQTNALAEYRQENSSVEGFIAECLEVELGNSVSARDLFEEYRAFCLRDGRKPKSNIAFTKEMRAFCLRFGHFNYIERTSGHNPSKFENVRIINWSSEREAQSKFTNNNW